MDLKGVFILAILLLSGDLLAHQGFSKRILRRQQRCLNRMSENLNGAQSKFGYQLDIIKRGVLSLNDEDDLRSSIIRSSYRSRSWTEFFFSNIDLRQYPWVDFQSKLSDHINQLERCISSRVFHNNYLDGCIEANALKKSIEDCLYRMCKLADYIARNYEYIREVQALSARQAHEALLRSIEASLVLARPRLVCRPCVVYQQNTVIF